MAIDTPQLKSNLPSHLIEFQKNYSDYLRSPSSGHCPKGIPLRRSKVYEELVFNNTQSFIDKCFPVAKNVLNSQQWLHLFKQFFQKWSCHTPYFSQIPYEFVQFINNEPIIEQKHFPSGLPLWLGPLLHYEWVELEVELSNETVDAPENTKLKDGELKTNPTLMNLHYDWPVHNISRDNIPNQETLTHLLVYRTWQHKVEFMEINPLTSALVQLFEAKPLTTDTALKKLSNIVPNISQEQVFQFGRPLITQLRDRHILNSIND